MPADQRSQLFIYCYCYFLKLKGLFGGFGLVLRWLSGVISNNSYISKDSSTQTLSYLSHDSTTLQNKITKLLTGTLSAFSLEKFGKRKCIKTFMNFSICIAKLVLENV
jgi:hypothetical protein